MKAVGIIPARFNSTRFPGKPLADIKGKTMIRRVYEQAEKSHLLSAIFVATDDERIVTEVNSFSGNAIMTSPKHQSGTDRCFEVLEKVGKDKYDIVVNIQGDEPFIHPEQIDAVVKSFHSDTVQIATLGHKINDSRDLISPSLVKIARKANGEALYFSRSPIPFIRDAISKDWTKAYPYLKHIGIYAYRSQVLEEIIKLPMSSLEKAESLEQLRWLENGYSIVVEVTDKESFPVDYPEDLKKFI
ncbi:MAG TPA: 3-deoxy-manno-octulosonate cytidylyltransferase [Bacteroidia bacterium]|nr:3-deoxy-manno-octulosonate cytidylyltransferase [Bacteroidia bacterium]